MCGIAGYFSTDGRVVSCDPIRPMLASLRHRGPDGFGVYAHDRCVLGHARLSIIDLEGGWQPIFNEDGSLAVTYNGEIYNYVELRRDLEGRGHRFSTRSDTEVILHAYEEWGEECPTRFNGQFAFALWDGKDRSLFLCRDRLGVRPLYYARTGGEFLFASEVKALLASGRVGAGLDPAGLHQVFSYWTNVFPDTPFREVRELPPAHTLRVRDGSDAPKRYWEFPVLPERTLSPDDALEGTIAHLERSVRLRLRADVPVGAYLSGGLDSALTTTLAARLSGARLKTFSLEFEDPRFDESPSQRAMVRALGTEHVSLRCTPRDVVENFDRALWAVERPILRTGPVPMLLLSGLVRAEGYKVVITGEGADEFFLGYDIFKEAKVREFCSRSPGSRLRPLLFRKLYPYLFTDGRGAAFQAAFFLRRHLETADPFYGHRPRWDQASTIREYCTGEFLAEAGEGSDAEARLLGRMPASFPSAGAVERTQWTEVDTLLSGYLLSSQGDRVGMANSVEGRYVFLDHELIDFAASIPPGVRLQGLVEKAVLKRIGKGLLPEAVVRREKFPYRSPDLESFLRCPEGREILGDELSSRRLAEAGIFDGEKVRRLLDRLLARGGEAVAARDNLVLMAALSTSVFLRLFLERPCPRESFREGDRVLWLGRPAGEEAGQ